MFQRVWKEGTFESFSINTRIKSGTPGFIAMKSRDQIELNFCMDNYG